MSSASNEDGSSLTQNWQGWSSLTPFEKLVRAKHNFPRYYQEEMKGSKEIQKKIAKAKNKEVEGKTHAARAKKKHKEESKAQMATRQVAKWKAQQRIVKVSDIASLKVNHMFSINIMKNAHKFAEERFIAECKAAVARKQAELDQLKVPRQIKMKRQKLDAKPDDGSPLRWKDPKGITKVLCPTNLLV